MFTTIIRSEKNRLFTENNSENPAVFGVTVHELDLDRSVQVDVSRTVRDKNGAIVTRKETLRVSANNHMGMWDIFREMNEMETRLEKLVSGIKSDAKKDNGAEYEISVIYAGYVKITEGISDGGWSDYDLKQRFFTAYTTRKTAVDMACEAGFYLKPDKAYFEQDDPQAIWIPVEMSQKEAEAWGIDKPCYPKSKILNILLAGLQSGLDLERR